MSKPEVLSSHHHVIRFDALHWDKADMKSLIRRELHMTPRTYRRTLHAALADKTAVAEYPDEVRRIRYRLEVGAERL
jgi:hypothetical protein